MQSSILNLSVSAELQAAGNEVFLLLKKVIGIIVYKYGLKRPPKSRAGITGNVDFTQFKVSSRLR